jgi:hypothetical protein
MNIFVLHRDPELAAQLQVNKSLVKMVCETAQLLSTAVRQHKQVRGLYKPFCPKHPCNLWIMKSRSNFRWTVAHGLALADEYEYRYGSIHASRKVIVKASKYDYLFDDIGLTKFALAMPEEFKSNNPVKSYRDYYLSKSYVPSYHEKEFQNA